MTESIEREGYVTDCSVELITLDGSILVTDIVAGETIMQLATGLGIAGVIGECGGQMMCATCHVYDLSPEGTFDAPGEIEQEVLEGVASERRANSRLSCQLTIGPEAGAIRIELPVVQ